MRSIFVCKRFDTVKRVYADEVRVRIDAVAPLDARIYTKDDVLAMRDSFADVSFIFSTWGMPQFSCEEIREIFPSLKCVFYAAGTVQSFARPFIECGVKVYSAWAANAVPVAEYTVAQIILANKGFFKQTRLMKDKRFFESETLKENCVGNYGERVGIIGCGMIGSLVAKMLRAYDLTVCVYDPFISDERARELGVTRVTLEELFATCRVVSNHLASNSATVGMLDYGLFSSMMPNATFINTGRGAQVVEEELARVLFERADLTALLDVTEPEPCEPTNPFFSLDNCFMTPHIAGSLGNETVRMARYMACELEAYALGTPTRFEVTAKMLETMA